MIPIKHNTIFISIASYRDDVCPLTVKSIFDMAEYPENIFIGICQQNDHSNDTDCFDESYQYASHIKILRIPHTEAKGPTYARYLCSTLWNGEEFYMQIDSHTRFVKNWDSICINMINTIKNMNLSNKPVISHYPKEYSTYDSYSENEKYNVPRMCKAFFNERGMISFMGAEEINTNGIPYKTPYLASGMFFCESKFLYELPYDPYLPYLFVGEEILHSIRFYTHGWDIFTPSENVVFHEYTRINKPKIWTDNPYYSDQNAFNKVKYYLRLYDNKDNLNQINLEDLDKNLIVDLDKYGLGQIRTLDDFYNFAKIDKDKSFVYSNFCKPNDIASEQDVVNSNKFNYNKNNYVFDPQNENQGLNTFGLSNILLSILIILFLLLLLVGVSRFIL